MPKTAIAIRHLDFEDLGYFEEVLEAYGYKVHYYEAGVDGLWTIDPMRTSLVVILGGPMGVYEREQYPFLTEELQFIRERIAVGAPLLGICLGAQLIAHALGARVYPGPAKEIGLSPIRLTAAGESSPLSTMAADDPVLHWHGDTFDLPSGATLLASTDAYPHQAFSFGRHVLALQFHLEAGERIGEWIGGHADELRAASVDGSDLRTRVLNAAPTMKQAAENVFSNWLAKFEPNPELSNQERAKSRPLHTITTTTAAHRSSPTHNGGGKEREAVRLDDASDLQR